MRPPRHWQIARGYTLAELLIVLTIMIMLTAITLPVARRVMEDGKVREGSRELVAYFAMAKARALHTGRPCGVWMVCDVPVGVVDASPPSSPLVPTWPVRQVTQLFLAESPPPYSGATLESRGRIMPNGTGGYEFYPIVKYTDPFTGTISYQQETAQTQNATELPFLYAMIAPGEQFLVQFDHKGPWFSCYRNLTNNFIWNYSTAVPPLPPAFTVGGTTNPGYTYEILRMPKRIGNPMELTDGSCIDMTYSGMGPDNLPSQSLLYGMFPTTATGTPAPGIAGLGLVPLQSVVVMFAPGSGIDTIYLNSDKFTYAFTPATTAHFLVGRTNKVSPPFLADGSHPTKISMYDPAVSNLADPEALWVSVSRSTGLVATTDNVPPSIEPNTASATNIVMFPGTPQQMPAQGQAGLNPQTALVQTLYLAFCRQNATNREQVRGQ